MNKFQKKEQTITYHYRNFGRATKCLTQNFFGLGRVLATSNPTHKPLCLITNMYCVREMSFSLLIFYFIQYLEKCMFFFQAMKIFSGNLFFIDAFFWRVQFEVIRKQILTSRCSRVKHEIKQLSVSNTDCV